MPVDTWDERMSTLQAERYLREAGVPPRRWKERVNQMAAQIVLQSYLDAHRPEPPGGSEPGEEDLPDSEAQERL